MLLDSESLDLYAFALEVPPPVVRPPDVFDEAVAIYLEARRQYLPTHALVFAGGWLYAKEPETFGEGGARELRERCLREEGAHG
ncbi:MAG TPA: hypothetical protein VLT87_11275 [Thermoanaerobaculia bacterium]|nr:hypothetical protein [Thermoanaerobaculia bacterium]